MQNESKIYVLIPAYNEEKMIGAVINDLKKNGYHNILVVDDASMDRTAEVAKGAGAEVITHLINRGQGAALQTGIEYLRENYNPEIIVTFDADGQHHAEEIDKLIQPIIKKECDIVLGTRFRNINNEVPLLRKIVLKAGVLFTNLTSGVNLTDTHNGLRAFGQKAINSIIIRQRGMEHASEIIDEIKRNKLRYKEVPVKITYSAYSKNKGQKSSNMLKIGIKVLIGKLTK